MHRFRSLVVRFCGIPWAELPNWITGNRLRILLYHSISDNPRDPHSITPSRFEEQMEELSQKGTKVISLKEGIQRLINCVSLKKHIAITFDDAYSDFHQNALPILEDHGFPATMFVPTGLVGKNAEWDSYDQIKPLMNWDEIQEISGRGIELGSHTVSHRRLAECDEGALEHELRSSLDALQERCENVIPALAYPGGYYGPREMSAAKEVGYSCALGGASRWGNGPETDLFQLRRERFEK